MFVISKKTNGKTPQNIFEDNGAPSDFKIVSILLISCNSRGGYIKIKNGTSIINDSPYNGTEIWPQYILADRTTYHGEVTGVVTINDPIVLKGDSFTVESNEEDFNVNAIIFMTVEHTIRR